jgi:RNA polymerase sigma-70 factor (ECF subfamily)
MGVPADELRFSQLWIQAHPAVSAYVYSCIPDRAAAEDVLQEAALALLKGFERYDHSRPFVAWAMGVTKNKIQDRWRSLARERPMIRDPELVERLAEVSAEMSDAFDEQRVALQHCLRGVEGRSWELLKLHYHEGHQPKDIAERLGLKSGHVRVLLNRIRAALRACIEKRLATRGSC